MKTTKIYYKRLFAMEGYNNCEVGIEVELEENETKEDALKQAKRFVESQNPCIRDKEVKEEYEKALKQHRLVLSNMPNYTEEEVLLAAKFIRAHEYEDLPF